MKKRIVIIFNFIVVVLFSLLCTNSLAESEIKLVASDSNVELEEEFYITAEVDNLNIAAYTVWIYFDSEKVECVSYGDNINVIDNRIIYTWLSDTGLNISLEKLVEIKFKAKQEGIASFSIIGEFYNENGESIDIKYNQVDVGIGENYLVEIQSESDETNSNDGVSNSNAKLKILRLNMEGVNPNFNQDIKEYYLIVNEDTENLDITAIPANSDADVQITGNENLKNGLNEIKIVVTSKDKTNTEEYVINVTKTNNVEAANANLETLAVEYYTLSPEYQETVTNYAIEVSNETEALNILAIPSNEDAEVQISGNENLEIGENQVTITVTATNGITSKKYIIDVYRRNEEEELEYAEEQQQIIDEANQVIERMSNDENFDDVQDEESVENKIFMIIGILLSIIVIGIVIIRIRKSDKK